MNTVQMFQIGRYHEEILMEDSNRYHLNVGFFSGGKMKIPIDEVFGKMEKVNHV